MKCTAGRMRNDALSRQFVYFTMTKQITLHLCRVVPISGF